MKKVLLAIALILLSIQVVRAAQVRVSADSVIFVSPNFDEHYDFSDALVGDVLTDDQIYYVSNAAIYSRGRKISVINIYPEDELIFEKNQLYNTQNLRWGDVILYKKGSEPRVIEVGDYQSEINRYFSTGL